MTIFSCSYGNLCFNHAVQYAHWTNKNKIDWDEIEVHEDENAGDEYDMRTPCVICSGKVSLNQFGHGLVVIGNRP